MAKSRFSAFLQRVRLLITGQSVQERREELGHQFFADAAPAGRLSHTFGVGTNDTITIEHSFNIPGIDLVSGLYHEVNIDLINTTKILTHQFNVNELIDKQKILAHTFTVPLSSTSGLAHSVTVGLAASSGLNQEFNVPDITVSSGLNQQFDITEINKTKVLANTFAVSQETTSGVFHSFAIQQTTTSGLEHTFNIISVTTTTVLGHEFNIDQVNKTSILVNTFGVYAEDTAQIPHTFGINSTPQTSGLNHEFNIYGIIVNSGLNHELNVPQINDRTSILTQQFGIEFASSGQIYHQFTIAYPASGELSQEFNIDSIYTTANLAHSFEMNVTKSKLSHQFSAIGEGETTKTLAHQLNVEYDLPFNRLQHQFRLVFSLPLPEPTIHSGEFKFIFDDSTGSGMNGLSIVSHSGVRAYSYSDPAYTLPLSSGTWNGIGTSVVVQPSLNSTGTRAGHALSNVTDLDRLEDLEFVGTTYLEREFDGSAGLQQFYLDLPANAILDSSRRSQMQIALREPTDTIVSLTLRRDCISESFTSGGNNQAIVNFRTGIVTLGFDIGDDPGDGFRDDYPPWTNALRNAADVTEITTAVSAYISSQSLDFASAVGPITNGLRGRPDGGSTVHAFYYYLNEVPNGEVSLTKASGLVEADYLYGSFAFHNTTILCASGTLTSWPEHESDTTYLHQRWTSPVVTSGDRAWDNIDDYPIRFGPATLSPGEDFFGPFFGRQLVRSGVLLQVMPTLDQVLYLSEPEEDPIIPVLDPFVFHAYTISGDYRFPLERDFMISGIYISQPNGTPGLPLRRTNTITRLGFTYYEQEYQPEELSWSLGHNTPSGIYPDVQSTDQWVLSGLYRDFTTTALDSGDILQGRIRALSPKQNTTFSGIYPEELLAMSSSELVNLLGGGILVWPDIDDIESILEILYTVSGLDRARIPAMITLKYEDVNSQPKVLRISRQGTNDIEIEVLQVSVDADNNEQFGTLRTITDLNQSITTSNQLSRQAITLYKKDKKNNIPKLIFVDQESD